MGISQEDRDRIVQWARKYPEIRAIYLYGSRARGENRPDSDIDLAVQMGFGEWFGWIRRFRANPDLELSHPVDLEWSEKDAGLERVGRGVERDGKLIYSTRFQ
jgi:predicted nucleotidyltransferase